MSKYQKSPYREAGITSQSVTGLGRPPKKPAFPDEFFKSQEELFKFMKDHGLSSIISARSKKKELDLDREIIPLPILKPTGKAVI